MQKAGAAAAELEHKAWVRAQELARQEAAAADSVARTAWQVTHEISSKAAGAAQTAAHKAKKAVSSAARVGEGVTVGELQPRISNLLQRLQVMIMNQDTKAAAASVCLAGYHAGAAPSCRLHLILPSGYT